MNRLDGEASPYLRQHRHNPVDWYPWGPEAFASAVERDRPVLLSVGYSSCHWCHVMAHESFEDPDTAAVMNELFVNVKVDREERPDVDAVYMDSVQALTGRGGWPMTVFLTPDGKPFYGGTYYPDRPRGGMASFRQVMAAVDDAWRNRRSDVTAQAGQLTELIERTGRAVAAGEGPPEAEALDRAAAQIKAAFDPAWGGFGGAPKFPAAMTLASALRLHRRTGDPELLGVVTTSLDAMASGGIYDHLGGGFARYSVDQRWLVPHFEKMLYDNALLARAYLHAWLVTGNPAYRQVLDETVGYVLRDLRHPDGGFYSAEDADSEGVEGKFYVWSLEELAAVAGEGAAEAVEWWGVTAAGNFEGANILHRPVRGDLARPPAVEAARRRLFEHREHRVRPGLDDKVLAEWNALMLAGLCEAAASTGNPEWAEAAVANGEFLTAALRRDDGRWLRSWQAGGDGREAGARHLACAHDYGALTGAFIDLAELTGRARWIEEARAAADGLIELFWDDESGGVYTTGADAEALVTRPKDLMDNATPSAQSNAAVALLRLGALTGEAGYVERAESVLSLLGAAACQHPTAFGHLLQAVDMHAGGLDEIVVVGDRPDLVAEAQTRYRPNSVLAWGEPYPSPLWTGRQPGFAYVCRQYTCQTPATTPTELAERLNPSPRPRLNGREEGAH